MFCRMFSCLGTFGTIFLCDLVPKLIFFDGFHVVLRCFEWFYCSLVYRLAVIFLVGAIIYLFQ